MNKAQKLYFLCKEIGIPQLAEFASYQLSKKTGLVAKRTSPGGLALDFFPENFSFNLPIPTPDQQALSMLDMDRSRLVGRAEEIVQGFYHPFGGEKRLLSFDLDDHHFAHWTEFGDTLNGLDIKWTWEPARFSWAFDLARAYLVQPDKRYVEFFWEKFSEFEKQNPVNCGPNWVSAQEAAMRIITWTMVYQVFKDSPATTSEKRQCLSVALWQHAGRIPPTLVYARSQNNNHLLSEALGLIVAGAAFSKYSKRARKWLKLGFNEFNKGLLKQIEPDGTYVQHSANYHRLMLQLSLIYYAYAQALEVPMPAQVSSRLAAATRWLTAQLDAQSGRLPNLGHNDGTLLLPMGCTDFRDYRPVAQAASLAFLGKACLPPGAWNELSLWLGLQNDHAQAEPLLALSPAVHKITSGNSWATLRGVQFHGRPAHADQLHLELWSNGINLAQDAGTFAYNDPPPWQNPFSSTLVHNTLSIDEKDQMLPAGKFLWLAHAQAEWLPTENENTLSARHNGYRKKGITHQRTVRFENESRLNVIDVVGLPKNGEDHLVTLHWLLPDWFWSIHDQILVLEHDQYQVEISVTAMNLINNSKRDFDDFAILRAGETLHGRRSNPILGWMSDTYGQKKPAVSFSISCKTNSDLQFITDWKLPLASNMRKA